VATGHGQLLETPRVHGVERCLEAIAASTREDERLGSADEGGKRLA